MDINSLMADAAHDMQAQILKTKEEEYRDLLFDVFNTKFAVVNLSGKARVLNDFERSPERFDYHSFADFKNLYCNETYTAMEGSLLSDKITPKTKKMCDYWINSKNRREYIEGIVFDPSNNHKPSQKNLWTGFAVTDDMPRKPPNLWLKHMLQNVCQGNEELFHYILDYYAHAVQKPWELPGVALVFRGGKGVGKGTAIRPLSQIFGPHFYQTQDQNKVLGKFNAIVQNKIIIFLNETVWGGYKAFESVLKGYITETTRDIEMKGVDGYQVENFARVIIDSNESWAAPMGVDERRFCCINIPDHPRKQDNEYFNAITTELNSGGTAGLFDMLKDLNISDFKPMRLPSGNADRGQDMALRSLGSIAKFLLGWLEDNCDFNDLIMSFRENKAIKRNEFHAFYLKYCKENNQRPEDKTHFYSETQRMLGIEIKKSSLYYFKFTTVLEMTQNFYKNVLHREYIAPPSETTTKTTLIKETTDV